MSHIEAFAFSNLIAERAYIRSSIADDARDIHSTDEARFCSLVATVLRCRRCSLLVSQPNGFLSLAGAVGLPREIAPAVRVRLGDRVAGWVALTGEPWIGNLSRDTSSMPVPVATYATSSFVSYPFRLPGGTVAVISATERDTEEPFGDLDVDVLSRLCALYASSRTPGASQGESMAHVDERQQQAHKVRILEGERKRLAQDLHDDIGHRITATILRLDTAASECTSALEFHREIKSIRQQLRECLDGLNDVAFSLRPRVLSDFGIVPGLRALARRAQDASGIRINVCSTGEIPRFGEPNELAAFRITQEALTNALKHAHASVVDITLQRTDNWLVLAVADNGIGFDPNAIDSTSGLHTGLKGICDRAGMIGGIALVESAPGFGTTVRAQVPLGEVTT